MNAQLKAIYNLFKPMVDTVVWSNKTSVTVAWKDSNGYMIWTEENGRIKFKYEGGRNG